MPISNAPSSRRPSLTATVPALIIPDVYSDSRTHGHQGPTKHARLPRAASFGGGSIAKCSDGQRCVVAGKESLRILRLSDPGVESSNVEHKFVIGRGGYRIDASRNLWKGSGLKIDSTSTDVVWACGEYSNKILTSARNGELIMWDLNKTGPSKYERRTRDHVRSINKIAYSAAMRQYCITCSSDGDLRVWDLRDLTRSMLKVHHPTSVRTVVASPTSWQPKHAFAGLDNGSIYRWDLDMGQRGQLDRIPVAHNGPILAMDWTIPSSTFASRTGTSQTQATNWLAGVGSNFFEDPAIPQSASDTEGSGMGWLATGGLDRCVKVWDLTSLSSETHMPKSPTYTLHTTFPIRKVLWRPGPSYECELAVVSNTEFSGSGPAESASPSVVPSPHISLSILPSDLKSLTPVVGIPSDDKVGICGGSESPPNAAAKNTTGDPVEIWDVRRGSIAKWRVRGSAIEGGVTDVAFADSHTILAEHVSGSFSQFDLRQATRPIDAIPRVSTTWDVTGSMVFAADKPKRFEIPYDDVHPERRQIIVDRKGKVKALGDKSYQPSSQTVGLLSGIDLVEDIEVFVKLAEGYVFEGNDRPSICAHNAEVALDVGMQETAQTWLLLESLLTDLATPAHTAISTPALSPLPITQPLMPHTPSATVTQSSAPSSTSTALANPPSSRALSGEIDPVKPITRTDGGSPSLLSRKSHEMMSTNTGYLSPQRITPASSTTSSPHRTTLPLPAAILVKRASISGISSTPQPRPRIFSSSPSHHRRPSINAPSVYNAAPSESSIKSGTLSASFKDTSLKDVGDGALSDDDDDDTDGCFSDGARSDGPSNDQGWNDDYHFSGSSHHSSTASGKSTLDIPVSPFLYPHSRSSGSHIHPAPSPLSRVAVKHDWTEDEGDEEDDSPSPPPTDESESSSGDEGRGAGARKDVKGKGTQRSRVRVRNKSVTSPPLSSIPPPGSSLSIRPPKLTKQESSSSIRTVTAVNSPIPESEKSSHRDMRRNSGGIRERDYVSHAASTSFSFGKPEHPKTSSASFLSHRRLRSSFSADFLHEVEGRISRMSTSIERHSNLASSVVRGKSVEEEQAKEIESRLREVGWQALRDSIDVLADEGDIQMCTMLALVASEELRVSKFRIVRFLEAYIDILVRLRLHTTTAYMRKYAPAEDVRTTTTLDTVIHALCGKCGRPMMRAATARQLTTTPITSTAPLDTGGILLKPRPRPKPNGNYGFCLSCKEITTSCSVCHLPVRALLFKCPVCMHGGHQSCYQNYYLRQPLEITSRSQRVQPVAPAARPSPRGRPSSKSGEPEPSEESAPKDADDGARSSPADAAGSNPSIYGHPCAAGCGHYCWATNEPLYGRVIN